jgi:hypothetical protein
MTNKLKEHGLAELPNLQVTEDEDIWPLIESAAAIVGLKSTTTLEASIYHKPILMPVFREFQEHPAWYNYGFREYLDLFTPCEDEATFFDQIELILQGRFVVSDNVAHERRRLFEKYISPLDGKNSERLIKALDSLIRVPE